MTPFEVCDIARKLVKQHRAYRMGAPRVRVWLAEDAPITGPLEAVSTVNAWVKVGGAKVPTDVIKRIEIA